MNLPHINRQRPKARETASKPHRKSVVTRVATHWWNRLLGATQQRSFAGQEEQYDAHQTSRDFICNSIGMGAWSMVFPILTIVITQVSGAELAGMFSLAFITATLLMIVANYGARTFQVSDLQEKHSFADYQVHRLITCAIMLIAGLVYCTLRGYTDQMLLISIGVYLFKMFDGLADVYEGRLQQSDKMYLAGISQGLRSIVALVLFCLALLITQDVGISCVVMAVVHGLALLLVTLPLAFFETTRSRRPSLASVGGLFKECFTAFLALFLYALIDNMPKFVMEGVLTYDNQLYFNALYFPAQAILMTAGTIYKPLLVRLASEWADPKSRHRFDIAIVAMLVIIVAMTLTMVGIMWWIGIPILSFLYGIDFEPFRGLSYVMVAAGGVTAAIDFLYQIITVLRRQRDVTKFYLFTFAFSILIPVLLINFTGLPGAVTGYLIVMSILFVFMVYEYIVIRLDLGKAGRPPLKSTREITRRKAAARLQESTED